MKTKVKPKMMKADYCIAQLQNLIQENHFEIGTPIYDLIFECIAALRVQEFLSKQIYEATVDLPHLDSVEKKILERISSFSIFMNRDFWEGTDET